MNIKNPLISGTLILTIAGLVTRAIGFINRIYLSQLIGAEEMGSYQLVFPVYLLVFSLCCHGMELALSQITARFAVSGKKQMIPSLVFTACCISVLLASFSSVCILKCSGFISNCLIGNQSLSLILRMMSPILPFTAFRCCLHGYYIGLKKTGVPAAGQLLEQLVRVSTIFLISTYYKGQNFSAALAIAGMITGEIFGTFFTFFCYRFHAKKHAKCPRTSHRNLAKELLIHAVPLTWNKLTLTIFASVETVLIPFMLSGYYDDQSLALSLYGVLTGMALPFIMFPSTITNSLIIMLLPAISEASEKKNRNQLLNTIEKAVKLCLALGFTALVFFFCFGKQLGTFVFHNESAGDFLFILSFLCPFLYLSQAGASILNGLGQMKQTFFCSMTGLLVRIAGILFLIPKMGIRGYLISLLLAYLLIVGNQIGFIYNFYKHRYK